MFFDLLASIPSSGQVFFPTLPLNLMLCSSSPVRNKTVQIHDLVVEEEGADLRCLTETWLEYSGNVNLTQLSPPSILKWGVAVILWGLFSCNQFPAQYC